MAYCYEFTLHVKNSKNYPRLRMLYRAFDSAVSKIPAGHFQVYKDTIGWMVPKIFMFVDEPNDVDQTKLKLALQIENEGILLKENIYGIYDLALQDTIKDKSESRPTAFVFMLDDSKEDKKLNVEIPEFLLNVDKVENILFLKAGGVSSRGEFYDFLQSVQIANKNPLANRIRIFCKIFHSKDKMFNGTVSRLFEDWFYRKVCASKSFTVHRTVWDMHRSMKDDLPYNMQIILSRIPGIREFAFDGKLRIKLDADIYDKRLEETMTEVNNLAQGIHKELTKENFEKCGNKQKVTFFTGTLTSGSKINRCDFRFGTAAVFAKDKKGNIFVLTNDHVVVGGSPLYVCLCGTRERCSCSDQKVGTLEHTFPTHQPSALGGMVDVATIKLQHGLEYDVCKGFSVTDLFNNQSETDIFDDDFENAVASPMVPVIQIVFTNDNPNDFCLELFTDDYKNLIGKQIHKLGAATSLTSGIYSGFHYITPSEIEKKPDEDGDLTPNFGEAPRRFDIVTECATGNLFSKPGDSGSVIVHSNMEKKTISAAFLLIGQYSDDVEGNLKTYLCCRLTESLFCLNEKYGIDLQMIPKKPQRYQRFNALFDDEEYNEVW